jgi:hypothetical protein
VNIIYPREYYKSSKGKHCTLSVLIAFLLVVLGFYVHSSYSEKDNTVYFNETGACVGDYVMCGYLKIMCFFVCLTLYILGYLECEMSEGKQTTNFKYV